MIFKTIVAVCAVLLALGGGYIFYTSQADELAEISVDTNLPTATSYTEATTKTEFIVTEDTSTDELVAMAEHYFSHDSDAAGTYDIDLARRYYEKAIEKDPHGNSLMWYQLGRIDFIEGRFDDSLYKFEKQREYFPDEGFSVDYMVGLTYGYKARRTGDEADWQQAEAAFQRFIEFEPNAPWGRVDLAWIYFAQGKFEEIKPVVAEGLLYTPDNAWLHNMFGLAMMNTGDQEGAKRQFEAAKQAATKLSPADWGESYPGNDPTDWEQGLSEFKSAINKNLSLMEQKG